MLLTTRVNGALMSCRDCGVNVSQNQSRLLVLFLSAEVSTSATKTRSVLYPLDEVFQKRSWTSTLYVDFKLLLELSVEDLGSQHIVHTFSADIISLGGSVQPNIRTIFVTSPPIPSI